MKCWEILKEISENPKTTKKWESKDCSFGYSYIGLDIWGELRWFNKDKPQDLLVSVHQLMNCNWEEYKPPVDWSKVPKDTKVWVKDRNSASWEPRYFSHCGESGTLYMFVNGLTSWTARGAVSSWGCCRLADEVEENKQ